MSWADINHIIGGWVESFLLDGLDSIAEAELMQPAARMKSKNETLPASKPIGASFLSVQIIP